MLRMYYQIEKFDKDMNLIESKSNISRSLLRSFLDSMYVMMKRTALSRTLNDINNTARTLSTNNDTVYALSSIDGNGYCYSQGDVAYLGYQVGIQIGTGGTAPTYSEYQLAGLIVHGIATGKMLYGGGVTYDAVVDGAYSYFDTERIFKNSSGGSILIKELGIASFHGAYSFLICRDALEEADWVTVADGEYLRVTYRLRVTS